MFDALERGRKIEDHEGWKIRSLSFSLPLCLSLENLKKFKKFKEKEQERRRKKKKKSGTSWILHITKDSLPSQKKNCTLSTVRASHISTPILYANPNPNLTRPNTENRLTTSRAITNAWNIFIPEQLPSPFSARQMVGLSFRVYTRTCVDLKNSKFAREEKKRIHRLFGKQVEGGKGSVITRCKKWGTEMERSCWQGCQSEGEKLVFTWWGLWV